MDTLLNTAILQQISRKDSAMSTLTDAISDFVNWGATDFYSEPEIQQNKILAIVLAQDVEVTLGRHDNKAFITYLQNPTPENAILFASVYREAIIDSKIGISLDDKVEAEVASRLGGVA